MPTTEFESTKPAYHRVQDYFGLWSMYEPAAAGLFALVAEMDLVDHVNERMLIKSAAVNVGKLESLAGERMQASEGSLYSVSSDGVAVMRISGTMMKAQSSFSESASSVQMRSALRQAGRDPAVRAVMVIFDSPGGTVAGTGDLAAEFAAVGELKPTAAYCEDCCASAAYYVASQAGFIACNKTAMVGSIGTMMAVRDTSGMANEMKVKVHLIKTGSMKGIGTPGSPITEEQIAYLQELTDSQNANFLNAVSAGRKMPLTQVKTIADGRVWVGEEAKSVGLVDAVQSLDETMRQLVERAGKQSSNPKKGAKMTEVNTTATIEQSAATIEEMEANLKGADAGFILKQYKAKATLVQALTAWNGELATRLESKDKELSATTTALQTAGSGGIDPLGTQSGGKEANQSASSDVEPGSAVERFNTSVAEMTKDGRMSKAKAISKMFSQDPDFHAQYLAEVNKGRKAS